MNGVSFIVTIYNKARYLPGVLAALRAQSGTFERQYVLVDDGSTDGSGEVAAAIIAAWPNAQLIRQDNQGPSAAVNRGLAAATMPFTYLVDGDDILAPYATRLLMDAALKTGCGAVWGRSAWYGRDEAIVFPDEPASVEVTVLVDALYEVIRRGHAGGSTYILDTAILKRAGGCDTRVFVQDQSVAQRMALAAPIGLVDHLVCLGPRDDPGRLMKYPVQQMHDQSLTALLTLRDHPELPWQIRRLVQRQVTGRAWKWAARNDGASVLSAAFLRFLAAHVPGIRLSDRALMATLDAFRRRNAIRLMPPFDRHTRARS